MKVPVKIYDVNAWIHGGEKVAVQDEQEVTIREFMEEDITHVDGALYPYHAFDALEVEAEWSEKDIPDDNCDEGEPPVPPTPTDPPTISGADDVTIEFGSAFNPRAGVTATDSLGRSIPFEVSGYIDTEVPGAYTLTYTATDSAEHTTTVTRVVTVATPTTAPTFAGVGNTQTNQGISIDLEEGVSATDAMGREVAFTVSPQTIDDCVVGANNVTYTATDEWGNTATVTRVVTVIQIANPYITGLSKITVEEQEQFNPLDGVSAVDGNGNTIAVTCNATNPMSYPTEGDYQIEYTATDACGNTTTQTRDVEVTALPAPVITGADNVTINQGIGIDLEEGVSATLSGTPIPFTVNPQTIDECAVDVHSVVYSATGNGKTTTVTRVVTIVEIPDPVISGLTQIEVDENEEFDPYAGVTAVDGNGNSIEVTCDATNPMSYPTAGTYQITYGAVDGCGRGTSETRTVVVHGLMTTLYTDGTLIFNESTRNRATSTHGDVVAEYAPLSDDNPYVFANGNDQPWVSNRNKIRAVEFATPVAPTNMSYWFQECRNMDSIGFTNLDTSNNTGLRATFSKTAFTTMSGLPAMPNLETLRYTFALCPNLTTVNLSSLKSTKVTDCNATFQGCYELLNVTLKFGNSQILLCANMFSNESEGPNMKLKKIVNTGVTTSTGFEDRPNFSQATSSTNMFRGCVDLVGGGSTSYDPAKVDKTWARCAFGVQQGYFTVG